MRSKKLNFVPQLSTLGGVQEGEHDLGTIENEGFICCVILVLCDWNPSPDFTKCLPLVWYVAVIVLEVGCHQMILCYLLFQVKTVLFSSEETILRSRYNNVSFSMKMVGVAGDMRSKRSSVCSENGVSFLGLIVVVYS